MRTLSFVLFIVLLSFHLSSQNLAWGHAIGQGGTSKGKAIETDNIGNVYVSGNFGGTVDFDPGPSTYTLGPGGAFVTKSDSSGNLIWAKTFQGYAEPHAISIDSWGNVYVVGTINNLTDFDPSTAVYTLTAVGYDDVFICKINAAGNFVWAKQFYGRTYASADDIEIDSQGNIFIAGFYTDSIISQ
jgi:hypothetical protein